MHIYIYINCQWRKDESRVVFACICPHRLVDGPGSIEYAHCSRLNTKHVDLCTHLIEIISNKYYWLWLSWMISNEAGKYTADHLLPSRATRHSCGRFCLCVSLRLLSLSIIFISNRFIKCIYLHTSYSKSHKILRHLIFFSLSTWMILVVDVNPHNWRVHTLLSTILSRYFSHKRNTESNDA